MDEEWWVLLQAVIYTVRRRHVSAVMKGLTGEKLEASHAADQREIREAVIRMIREKEKEQAENEADDLPVCS